MTSGPKSSGSRRCSSTCRSRPRVAGARRGRPLRCRLGQPRAALDAPCRHLPGSHRGARRARAVRVEPAVARRATGARGGPTGAVTASDCCPTSRRSSRLRAPYPSRRRPRDRSPPSRPAHRRRVPPRRRAAAAARSGVARPRWRIAGIVLREPAKDGGARAPARRRRRPRWRGPSCGTPPTGTRTSPSCRPHRRRAAALGTPSPATSPTPRSTSGTSATRPCARHPDVIAALAERGIDDPSLTLVDVWTYGASLRPRAHRGPADRLVRRVAARRGRAPTRTRTRSPGSSSSST